MKNNILVSICSITYNHAPYIRQCLDGMLMQKTNFDFEIIINDDCSTDGTTEIIREYAEKYPNIIKPIYHEENQYQKGVRGMFNKFVFPKAQGKYIALCEGDDYWTDPLKLQKQVDFLENHNEYSMSHTAFVFYNQKLGVFENYTNREYIKEITNIDILSSYRIQTCSVVFRAELLKQLYKEDSFLYFSGYFFMGDTQLWYGLAQKGKIHYLSDKTCVYRKVENSACRQINKVKAFRFNLSSLELRYYLCKRDNIDNSFSKKIRLKYSKYLYFYQCYDKGFVPKFPVKLNCCRKLYIRGFVFLLNLKNKILN